MKNIKNFMMFALCIMTFSLSYTKGKQSGSTSQAQSQSTAKSSAQASITTTSSIKLINNYSQPAENVIFYNSTNQPISSPESINAESSLSIPSYSTRAMFTQKIGSSTTSINLTVSSTTSSKIFAKGHIKNNSTQTVSVNFYSMNSLMNNTQISITAGQLIPIITGATSISVMANSATIVPNQTINASTSYSISGGAWTLSAHAS